MSAQPVLDVQRVTLGYGGLPAVRDLAFSLAEGEILALLGPNGAGKSTTLNALAGFLAPMAGAINFNGDSIVGKRPEKLARLGVAHVPEGRGVFHGLTVSEHFRLCGGDADIKGVLDYFPALGEIGSRRAGVLSGGQQQMLSLACALARRPRLLLIDELSLGLAPIVVEGLLPVVRRFADHSGCAVLLVEQHVQLALEVADRAIVLAHGQVAVDGAAKTLLEDRALLTSSYMGERSLAP